MEKKEILEILEFEAKRAEGKAALSDPEMGLEYRRRAEGFNEAIRLIETLESVKSVQTFDVKYPDTKAQKRQWTKEYGTNAYWAGKHWARRKRDAEFWHWLVKASANKVMPTTGAVEVWFSWDDALDVDNHSIMGKMIIDALKGTVIADDNRKILKAVRHGFNGENVIRVQIRELEQSGSGQVKRKRNRRNNKGGETAPTQFGAV